MRHFMLVVAALTAVSAVAAQDIVALRLDSYADRHSDETVYFLADVNKQGHLPDVWAYNINDPERFNIWVGTRIPTSTPGLRASIYTSWVPETSAVWLQPGIQYSKLDRAQRTSGWLDLRLPLHKPAKLQATLMDVRKEWRVGDGPVYIGLCGRTTWREGAKMDSRWGVGVEMPGKKYSLAARYLFWGGEDEVRLDSKFSF